MRELTIDELDKIIYYADSSGAGIKIFFNSEIKLPSDTHLGYQLISSDIVGGIAITGGIGALSGLDLEVDEFFAAIDYISKLKGFGQTYTYKHEGQPEVFGYMPEWKGEDRCVLWHEDKSLIGEFDLIQKEGEPTKYKRVSKK